MRHKDQGETGWIEDFEFRFQPVDKDRGLDIYNAGQAETVQEVCRPVGLDFPDIPYRTANFRPAAWYRSAIGTTLTPQFMSDQMDRLDLRSWEIIGSKPASFAA